MDLDDALKKMAELHSRGAIQRHKSPFSDLPTHDKSDDLTLDFITKLVHPFYMEIGKVETAWIDKVKHIKPEINEDVCLRLLGDFNWRTRLVGAYFSAVKNYAAHIDIIGTHLLKSELCCVGHIYALVLIYFNTEKCIEYLDTYLNYYLSTPYLYFDQKDVMEALLYLDKVNHTNHGTKHSENFTRLMKAWQKESYKVDVEYFEEQLKILSELAQQ